MDDSLDVKGVTESVSQTVQWLQTHDAPDLIFMDIHLSDGSAFHIFQMITVETPIIFTTAYDEYALDAFRVNSIDYILKPVDTEALRRAIEKFRKLTKRGMQEYVTQQAQLTPTGKYIQKILIPVKDKLLQNLPGTLLLAGTAVIMMLLISIPAGVVSALYRNRWPDQVIRVFTFLGVSMPSFWVGLILLYVFGLKLGLFPIAGGEVSLDRMILPAFTLAILLSSKYTRQVRTAVLEELGQDYVTGLKARGMSMQRILWRHVLPNAFLPLITLLGLAIGWLLGGVAVIEIVFSWPGIGRLAVRAIETRDYPLLQGFVLWIATLYMIVNLIVDISYTYLDPRLRKGAKS